MSVREYIGARYVPLFADPIEWDNTRTYEALTIVYHQGNSYTSKQAVPTGIAITNTAYWALTGNYNAQIEAYRQEVETYNNRISTLEGKFNNNGKIDTNYIEDEAVTTGKIADDAITTNKIDDGSVTTAKLDDGSVTTAKLNNGSVTTAKVADGAITRAKLAADIDSDIWDASCYAGTHVVIFGDSYTAPNIDNSVDEYWPKLLDAALGTIRKNFAVGGAGFGRSSNLVMTQVTNAINTMSQTEKDNTSLVILYAGCNDLLNAVPASDIETGIINCLNACKNAFTKAKILLIPFNWGCSYLTNARLSVISTIFNNIYAAIGNTGAKVQVVDNAMYWNLGIKSHFRNEVHPNQAGYRVICGNIISAIFGGETIATLHSSEASNVGTGNFIWDFKNGLINAYVNWTAGGNLTNYKSVFKSNMHILTTPEYPLMFPLYTMSDLIDNTERFDACGFLYLNNEGDSVIRINNLKANSMVYGRVSYLANANQAWSA